MIVNTLKKTSCLRFLQLFAALTAVCAVSCQTPFWRQDSDAEEQLTSLSSNEWMEQSSRAALLSLSAEDFQGLSSRGSPAQFHPLLMPLRSEISLTDRDFLLGTPNALGAIEGTVPEIGQCLGLPNSFAQPPAPESSASGERTTDAAFELLNPAGEPQTGSYGQLFFIHEQASRAVRYLGFFDDDGKARCQIAQGRWFISTGFGDARTHKLFSSTLGKETKISIKQHKRAVLRIRPGRDTGLQYGDLLRIGRIRAQQAAPQEADQLPEVALQVQEDLFRPVLSPSENFGVREYLFTSLIIQRREFSIPVEPGEYMIGLWRGGSMYRCADRLLVNANEHALLACSPEMQTARLSEKISGFSDESPLSQEKLNTLIFDASFMPSRLIGQSSFRAWMTKNGVSRLLRAGRTVDIQHQQIQFLLQPLMQDFSATTIQKPEGPYIGDFRLTQRAETDNKMGKANFARLLYAQSGMNVDSILTRVFSGLNFGQTIPMAGTTERGLLEGVVPLTFKTTLKSMNSRSFRTEGADTVVSNGAQIEWIEPLPAVSGTPLKLNPQQHLRVKLIVPPEDTTENLGMFINGERVKQWSISPEQSKSKFRTLEIDEKVNYQNDFFIGFASWGQNYLPEFMYGIRQLPALSFTRMYCIDINENGICDRQ